MARRDVLAWVIARTIWGEALWSRDQMEECYRIADAVTPVFTQTDDGTAVAAQSMGGWLPPAVPSSLTEGCDHSESLYGRCVACGMTWEQQSSSRGPGPAATIGGQPGPVTPRCFELVRHRDLSGVSGTGDVAEGCLFTDGSVALRWRGDHPATAVWPDLESVLAVHGHQGATEVRWISTDVPIDLWPAEGGNRG